VLRKHGVSFYAYSPLAMGMLAGGKQKESLEAAQTLPPGSRCVSLRAQPADFRFHPESRKGVNFQKSWFKQENFEAVKILNRTAAESGITPTALSLRWLAHVSTRIVWKAEQRSTPP
jgi:aryl-alcohol dehydrogenase-like predicted oxidoreductase